MNRFHGTLAMGLLALSTALALAAGPVNDNEDPKLTHWQWFAEVRLPAKVDGALHQSARSGEGLRQVHGRFARSASGRRRRQASSLCGARHASGTAAGQRKLAAALVRCRFHQEHVPSCYQFKVEVGQVPAPGYNEIEVLTPGTNFRRRIEVLGDNNASFDAAQKILEGEIIWLN